MRSFGEILQAVGARARELRLVRNLRQAELADRAGVGVVTIHRFETTGKASMGTVLRIAVALHAEAAFEGLFEGPPYASLDEVLARDTAKKRRNATPRRAAKRARVRT